MNWRPRVVAWSAVALAGLFSGWVWLQDGAEPVPPAAARARTAQAPHPAPAIARAFEREPLVDAANDPFKVAGPPPPPKPVEASPPPPPVAPVAPPFPYHYLGRMLSVDGKQLTYLTRGDAMIPIQLHQVLDQDYRVDALSDAEIVITYLPLDERVRIVVRSAEN